MCRTKQRANSAEVERPILGGNNCSLLCTL